MISKKAACIALGSVLLVISVSSAAHHGAAGLFDEARTVELKGVVKEWTFVNPHPVLILEIAEANGEAADWDIYFGPQAVAALRRRGFSAATFVIGENIVVKGHPATAVGVRGIDVWGTGTSVLRSDGRAVP
jgi:hypothetical protein